MPVVVDSEHRRASARHGGGVANMTRNAKGEWRSLETTKVRRSEKLIGAYYRNALALRLQALGYAITPTLIGRIPGFEIAG